MSGTVDIDADCINTWLQSTIKWNAGQELRSFSKTETANFLHSLREKLKQLFSRNGSLLDVLESCPNVGQLLGRMCGNSLILSDRQLYRALITCVLLFNVDSPQMALEVKAKQWALAQVRSTVSFSVGDMKSTLMSSVGFRQQELWEELLAQVLKDVTKLLTVPLRKWSSENNYFLPVSVPARLTGPMLHRVLSVTSSMPVTPALSALVGEIVKWVCHTQGDDPRLQQFMEDITIKTSCTFNSSYTDHILPVEGRSVLWTSYIPSIELELLTVVDMCLSKQPSEMKEIINNRGLAQACAENFSLFEAVGTMLTELLQSSCHCGHLVQVIGVFHHCIQDHVYQTRQDPPLSLLNFYPLNLRALVSVLQICPKDLSTDGCCSCIKQIENQIHLLLEQDNLVSPYDLWLLLIQFNTWYYTCLEMLLIAEKDIIPVALALIYWYIFPDTPEQQEQVKGHIKTLTVSLRGLLCKSTLCPQDLEYALLHAQPGPHSPLPQATQTSVHSVMTQLLSVFLLHAKGTGGSYTHILQMVTGSSDPAVHACSLVYTLENMNMAVDWGREDRMQTLLQYLLPWLHSLKEQLYGTGDKAVIECLEKWTDRFNLKQKS